MTGEPENVECILIADDLTGACDTGVQFVRCDLSCRVPLNLSSYRPAAMTDVLAFNTNRRKIEELAVGCSGLRANCHNSRKSIQRCAATWEEEIATALRAFRCEATVIAPAFPAMRRFGRDGILHWVD